MLGSTPRRGWRPGLPWRMQHSRGRAAFRRAHATSPSPLARGEAGIGWDHGNGLAPPNKIARTSAVGGARALEAMARAAQRLAAPTSRAGNKSSSHMSHSPTDDRNGSGDDDDNDDDDGDDQDDAQ